MLHALSNIVSAIRSDEKLDTFGQGFIHLNSYNIVYVGGCPQKTLTFGMFKRNIHFYSEMMKTPCVEVLEAIDGKAQMNARRSKKARENYMR